MLFAVDVGNSHTVSGIYKNDQLVGSWRLQSRHDRTADELAIRYHGLFQMVGIDPDEITGFIIASVVPVLETSWLHFVRNYLTKLRQPPLAVTHTLKLGMKVDTRMQRGPDRQVLQRPDHQGIRRENLEGESRRINERGQPRSLCGRGKLLLRAQSSFLRKRSP